MPALNVCARKRQTLRAGILHKPRVCCCTPRHRKSTRAKKLAARTLEADRSWTWQYLLILLQKKRYTLATQLVKETPAKYLPVNKKELSQILTNPSRWLQRNRKVLKKKPVRLLIAASLRIVQRISAQLSRSRMPLTAASIHPPKRFCGVASDMKRPWIMTPPACVTTSLPAKD